MLKEIKESLEVFEEEVRNENIDVFYNGDVDRFIREEGDNIVTTYKNVNHLFNQLKKEKSDLEIKVNTEIIKELSFYKFKEIYVKKVIRKRLRKEVKDLQEKLKEKLDK